MKLNVQHVGDIVILRPVGNLDAFTSPKFQEAVAPVMVEAPRRVILDLSGAPYVSSAGLRVLIVLAKEVLKQGKLAVTGLSANVAEVFKLAGFDRIMTLCGDLDAAKQCV